MQGGKDHFSSHQSFCRAKNFFCLTDVSVSLKSIKSLPPLFVFFLFKSYFCGLLLAPPAAAFPCCFAFNTLTASKTSFFDTLGNETMEILNHRKNSNASFLFLQRLLKKRHMNIDIEQQNWELGFFPEFYFPFRLIEIGPIDCMGFF